MNCRGNPCNFFLRTEQHGEGDHLLQGDRATVAAESPRLISSGGSEAGIETSITITGGGSQSGHVVDSKGAMRELILLGRSSAANPKDFARPGEPQSGRSVVGDGGVDEL